VKLNTLDLNKLNVFCAVVRNGGYRGASEELNLTRSAISQAIKNFENTLGLTLFNRVGTKLVITQEARRFYQEIQDYQNNLQNSLSRLTDQPKGIEGLVRVGSYLEFTKSQLIHVVEEFLREHPRVQLKFVFDAPSRLDRLLESGRIDVSISIFPHRGLKSIVSEKLVREELVLVAKKDLFPEKIREADLKKMDVIDYFQNHQIFKRWWKLHFTSRPNPSVRVYAATAEMVLQLVSSGLGMGVVPRYIFENFSKKSGLLIVQPTHRRLIDHIWLNRRSEASLNSAAETFLRMVQATISN
jgi:DNA-binding transcriptional LysR family regulator